MLSSFIELDICSLELGPVFYVVRANRTAAASHREGCPRPKTLALTATQYGGGEKPDKEGENNVAC